MKNIITLESGQPINGEITSSNVICAFTEISWNPLILISELFISALIESLKVVRGDLVIKTMLILSPGQITPGARISFVKPKNLTNNEKRNIHDILCLISGRLVKQRDDKKTIDAFRGKYRLDKTTNDLLNETLGKLSSRKINQFIRVSTDENYFDLVGQFERKEYDQPSQVTRRTIVSKIIGIHIEDRQLWLADVTKSKTLKFDPSEISSLCKRLGNNQCYELVVEIRTDAKGKITRMARLNRKDPVPEQEKISDFID